MSNSASDFLNAIKSMAQSVRNYVPTNFTGLHDTPTGYESYTDGFFVVPSGDRLVYDTVRFLDNVSDAPENQLVDGYLKLVEQNGNLVLQWSAGTTEGEVNYSIDGATHFTGLFDTPSGYKRGYYVRVKEDENKLEYISSTGLAEDTASEIANVIAHEKLLDFTGLGDTPTGYQTYTDGFFVVPSGDRLVYDKVKFLDNVSDAPSSVVDGGFLKVIQDNPDDPFRLEWEKSIENFTGLSDTPSNYRSYTDGFFVVPSGDRLVYDTIRFLDNVSDAPSSVVDGGFLKVIQDNPDDPFRLEWVQPDSIKHFTGLLDTPAEYNSGYYLMSNKTGIEYQSLTGLADRLVDYGFNTGTPILDFTGLQDTPPNYAFKQYLESTTDGLQYINANDLATTLGSIPKQYQDGVNFEGHLVNSGCDLYLVCNGQWIKYYSYNGILSSDSSDIPDCVNTVEELALYEQYKDYTTSEYGTNLFDEELNGPNPSTDFHNVCLFSSDSNSKVSIDETTYKWGIFNGDQTINLTALPGNGAGFSHWTGYGATFGNPNNQNTTTFVDKDLSITGVFNNTPTYAGEFDFDSSQVWDHRLLTYDVTKHNALGKNVDIDGDIMVVTSMDNDTAIGQNCYNHINILFAKSPIRYHTYIKNPNTNIFEQATLQTESVMVDGQVRSSACQSSTHSEYASYNTSINILSPGRIVVNGNRMAVYLPYFTYFNRNLGHSVDSALETEYRASWEKNFASSSIPTWDPNKIQTGAVKIYEWTGSQWVNSETILPIFRARGNSGWQDGDIINTPHYLGVRCHYMPSADNMGVINRSLAVEYSQAFGAYQGYEVYPIYSPMDLEGDRLYIEGSTISNVDDRGYDVAAIYERQNNGSWTQSEYIDWELRVNNMFSVRRDYNKVHGAYYGKISGDYMIINELDASTNYQVISWYKKNNQGLWEIDKFLGLNRSKSWSAASPDTRYLNRYEAFTLGFDIYGDTLVWSGESTSAPNYAQNCYFAVFDLKDVEYNKSRGLDYRSWIELSHNRTNNIDIGENDNNITMTKIKDPTGSYMYFEESALLNMKQFGFSNQVATNGEFIVAGWTVHANNRYNDAGTVFVYKRT